MLPLALLTLVAEFNVAVDKFHQSPDLEYHGLLRANSLATIDRLILLGKNPFPALATEASVSLPRVMQWYHEADYTDALDERIATQLQLWKVSEDHMWIHARILYQINWMRTRNQITLTHISAACEMPVEVLASWLEKKGDLTITCKLHECLRSDKATSRLLVPNDWNSICHAVLWRTN